MTRYHARRKAIESFELAAAQGKLIGHSCIHKFGRNNDVDTGNAEIVWDGGGSSYNWPTSACTLSVQSTSASDDDGESGARTVELFGLDSDFAEVNETLTLDGTSTVTSACDYRRIHRMIVRSAGSDGLNHGEISACGNSVGLAFISASQNQTLMTVFTIPASTDGYLFGYYASINKVLGAANRDAVIRLMARLDGEVFQVKEIIGVTPNNGPLPREYRLPVRYAEKTDFYISASVSDDNTDVSAGFDMLLIAAS